MQREHVFSALVGQPGKWSLLFNMQSCWSSSLIQLGVWFVYISIYEKLYISIYTRTKNRTEVYIANGQSQLEMFNDNGK